MLQNDTILSEMALNIKKTHSERLMPLIDSLLKESEKDINDINCVAVAAGPGSFTGLRIGVATARGLAQALDIPAVPVCTLEALAEGIFAPGVLICPLLDARRNQVYAAVFMRNSEDPCKLETLVNPAALSIDDLLAAIKNYDEPVVFLGEGLNSYSGNMAEGLPPGRALLTPAPFRLCRAALVAIRSRSVLDKNPNSSYLDLLPRYLRRPEAERLADERSSTS